MESLTKVLLHHLTKGRTNWGKTEIIVLYLVEMQLWRLLYAVHKTSFSNSHPLNLSSTVFGFFFTFETTRITTYEVDLQRRPHTKTAFLLELKSPTQLQFFPCFPDCDNFFGSTSQLGKVKSPWEMKNGVGQVL